MHRVARLFPFRRRVPLGDQLGQRYAQTNNQEIIVPLHFNQVEDLLAPFERLPDLSADSQPLPCNLNLAFVEYLYRRLAEIPDQAIQLRLIAPATVLAHAAPNSELETAQAASTAQASMAPASTAQALEDQLGDLIHQHFAYLETVKLENLKRLARDSGLLALLGFAALSLSIPVDALAFPDEAGMPLSLIGQGVTVFGWLTLWEALVNALWTWRPIHRQWQMCRRLQETAIALQLNEPSSAS
ncbi:MAG: hypothetical protein HC824_13440 [Synechococcales cyanobacterium RM1_1_8]|nr:hypothetical protein [Synechococcales cyanobacterium RM1_1_8]